MKRHYLPYLLISLVMMVGVGVFSYTSLQKLGVSTSIHDVMSTDDRSRATFDKFDEAFSSGAVVVALVKIDDLFSDEGVRQLYEISEALEAMPDLRDIKSLTHSSRPVKRGFDFDVRKTIFLENFLDLRSRSDEEWVKVKEFITAYPMTRDILVSADGEYATVLAVLKSDLSSIEQKKQVMRDARERMQVFIDRGLEIHFLSEPFVSAEFHDLVIVFIKRFILISLSLICIVLMITFRSLKILCLMLLYQAGGLLLCPIIFYLNLTDINVYTMIVLPLVSAVQLTFLTHFYAVFQDELHEGGSQAAVLQRTLKVVLRPSLIALMTSMVGMSALYFSELEILQSVGRIGAYCLLAVFVLCFGPALVMSWMKRSQKSEVKQEILGKSGLLKYINQFKYVILASVLFLAAASYFVFDELKTDLRAKEFLDEKSETRISLELLDKHFGGINIFQIDVVTQQPNGIQDYEVIKYLHDLRQRCLEIEGVRNAYTYSQFYTTIHQLFLGDNLSKGDVLPDEAGCFTYNMILNSQQFPFQDSLQNKDRSRTIFLLRSDDLPSEDFLKIVQEFQSIIPKGKPDSVSIEAKQGIHSLLESDQSLVRSQVNSLASSLVAILVVLLLLWRSLRFSVIALICNCVPLLVLVLIMYFLEIKLNSVTVMVGSIVLGIAVDDSIHFLSYYRTQLERGDLALGLTLKHKLRPMICTSLILVICFSLFLMAPFPPLRDFGILGAGGLLAALASSCLFLPVLLLLTEGRKPPSQYESESIREWVNTRVSQYESESSEL